MPPPRLLLAAKLSALVLMVGCGAPKGDTGGRVPVHETTAGERRSDLMRTSDLAGASERVASALAADLNRLAEEDFSGYRVTVILGDIVNKTGSMPTSDFEYVRSRIRSQLMRSRFVRDNLKFVENRARIESLNRREFEENEDLLQEGTRSSTAIDRPSTRHTYYLNGEAYGVHRGSTNLFYLTFQLQRASDTEIVFNKDYEVKYR